MKTSPFPNTLFCRLAAFATLLCAILTATTAAAATLPAVGFASGTPSTYTQGSSGAIRLTVSGNMPADADILVLAWSDQQHAMVKGFAFKLTQAPWQIAADQMAKLPTGRVQLQLLLRENSHVVKQVTRWVNIQAADTSRVVTSFPKVSFAGAAPASYTLGSGQSIPLSLSGTMPGKSDLLVLAWSDAQRKMVPGFAVKLTAAPWQIPAAALDRLPAGRDQLQVLARQDNQVKQKLTAWIQVNPKAQPKPQSTPQPTVPTVSFAANAPGALVKGSAGSIGLNVDGAMPQKGDILVLAWSDTQHKMVSGFSVKLTGSPWQIPAAALNQLPTGRVQLQALVRDNSAVKQKVTHWIQISSPASPQPTSTGDTNKTNTGQSTTPSNTGGTSTSSSTSSSSNTNTTSTGSSTGSDNSGASTSSGSQGSSGQTTQPPSTGTSTGSTGTSSGTSSGTAGSTAGTTQTGSTTSSGSSATGSSSSGSTGSSSGSTGSTASSSSAGDPSGGSSTGSSGSSTSSGAPAASGGSTGSGSSSSGTNSGATSSTTSSTSSTSGSTSSASNASGAGGTSTDTTGFSIKFATDNPAVYHIGSNATIKLTAEGTLPAKSDVLLLAWSDTQQRMINGFAYKLTGAPWQVSNAKLNTLPTGRVQLQAITRIPGQPWVKSVAWIDVQPATSTTSSGSSGSSSTSSSAGSTTTGTGNTTTGNTTSSGSTSASGSTVDSSSTGWTQFTKASDTRVIYVSSSQGNDSNSGLSPQTPVKTVQKGLSLMRNGHADWLLFKRGDVFTQGLGYINLSGPSAAHPIVFGNYGDPSLPRPEFRVGTFINTFNGQHDHIAIVGLHLIDSQRDPSSPDYNSNVTDGYGIRWFSDNGSDLLIENCLIEWYRMGLVISKVNNLRLRRNVIRDCYSNGSKDSSGAFISYSNHVLIQGNVFDQNGYLSFVGGDRSVRNHDIYLYNCTYLTAQNNILARASSMGIKCKGEGAAAASHDIQITGNLFLGDTIGLTFGQNGEVNYSVQNIAVSHNVFAHLGGNVVLEDGSTASQALGVDTKSIANATFDHNIFVNTPDPGQRTVWALNVSSWRPQKQITMSYNIVSPTFKYSMGPLMSNKGATTFLDNTTITDPSLYVNANCSVASYDTSIGGPGSIASFLNEADKQCKSNWRPAYTAQKAVNYFAQQLSYVPND